MTTGNVLRTAWRGMARNKLRSFLMMLGVVIGIAALTVILAVGAGTKQQVEESTAEMFAEAPITVIARRPGAGFARGSESGADTAPTTLTQDDARAILDQIANVNAVAPTQRQTQVPVRFRDATITTQVFGIAPQWQQLRNYNLTEGDFIDEEDVNAARRVCLLGPTVAAELFGEDSPLNETIRIEDTPFTVKGVLGAKGASPMGGDFDNRVVIPISTFSRRLFSVTHLSQIVVGLRDPSRLDASAAEIEGLMDDRHGIRGPQDRDFQVRKAEQVVAFAGQTSRLLTIFLAIVAAISLIVGGVVIMNIMLISVGERTQEIGLRRAVGASRRDIERQFRTEALLVTLTGGAVGVALGGLVAWALPMVSAVPSVFSWTAVLLAAVFSVGVGLVFGVQPARRAARLNPVEALRTE
ncbi:MAG: ABC transporter permease [Armatimonadota bacterium]|jgi:putative ABC transport system permease protein